MIQKIFLLALLAQMLSGVLAAQENEYQIIDSMPSIAGRGVVDMKSFSYAATVVNGEKLDEVSIGELKNKQDSIITVNSKLVFILPSHTANYKKHSRPMFADYALVKNINGHFILWRDAKDKTAVPRIFKYGNQVPLQGKSISLEDFLKVDSVDDKRILGALDLEKVIFYEMIFKKPGPDLAIWQTAMTQYDTVGDKVYRTMRLINFINASDTVGLTSRSTAALIELVPSVWSNQLNKFVALSETPWRSKAKTKRLALDIAFNADSENPPKSKGRDKSSDKSQGGEKDKDETIVPIQLIEAKSNSFIVKIDPVQKAKSYIVTIATDEDMKNKVSDQKAQGMLNRVSLNEENGKKIIANTTYYIQYKGYSGDEGSGDLVFTSDVYTIKSGK